MELLRQIDPLLPRIVVGLVRICPLLPPWLFGLVKNVNGNDPSFGMKHSQNELTVLAL